MKLSYEIFVRHEVYQILQSVSPRDQERICDFLESLADDPFREGDTTTLDEHGRAIQVKTLGTLALSIGPITLQRKFGSSIWPMPTDEAAAGRRRG